MRFPFRLLIRPSKTQKQQFKIAVKTLILQFTCTVKFLNLVSTHDHEFIGLLLSNKN